MPRLSWRPTLLRLAAAFTAAALAAAACGNQPAPPSGGSQGDSSGGGAAPRAEAPLDFRATTVDGEQFSGAALDGKPAVLWFWAPWCTICRAEGPTVAQIAQEHKDTVTFVGVAGRGEVPDMKRFVADTGTGSFTHVVDEDGSLWSSFGVTSQPAFAFIHAGGGMDVIVGSLPEDDLATRVAALAGRGGRPGSR